MRLVPSRRWLLSLSAAMALLGLLAAAALAADGDPDPSFDLDGRAVVDLTPFDDEAADVAIDSAGRLLVVGSSDPVGMPPERALIARFLSSGELDKTFSGDGFDLIPWPTEGSSGANAVTIDSAGRIVVAGDVFAKTGFDYAAARYQPSGELDKSFSEDGLLTLDVPGAGLDIARAVAVDGQDRVVLAGQAVTPGVPSVSHMGIVRFTASGAPDAGFDTEGSLLVDFPGRTDAQASSVAIDAAGRIVVGGGAGTSAGPEEFALARLLDGGGLDPGFGSGGRATLDFGTLPNEELEDLTLDGSGRIVVAGLAGPFFGTVVDVGRLLANGGPDPSFGGGDGTTTTAPQGRATARAVAVDRAGRVLVAGTAGTSFGEAAALFRYTPAGEPDQSFGEAGLVRTDFLAANGVGGGVAIDAEGRYVLAGTAEAANGARAIGLARFITSYPSGEVSPPPPSPPSPAPLIPAPPRCGGAAATIVGGPGKDRVRGTGGRDVVATLGGDDTVRSLGGNDLVCAGAGKDLVVGGGGADRVLGEGGADRLLGGPGRDKLLGQGGADKLLGGPGKDALTGGPGKDVQR